MNVTYKVECFHITHEANQHRLLAADRQLLGHVEVEADNPQDVEARALRAYPKSNALRVYVTGPLGAGWRWVYSTTFGRLACPGEVVNR